MKQPQGQTMIIVAFAVAALAGMFMLVINFGLLALDKLALDHAVENAALAAVRPYSAGDTQISQLEAQDRAQSVLSHELENLRCLGAAIPDVVAGAIVEVTNPDASGCTWHNGNCHHGPTVRVALSGVSVCPPLTACLGLNAERIVTLETDVQPPPGATAVPAIVVPVPLVPSP